MLFRSIPAIREIGILKFLFGKEWASTAAEPSYGILPFILTSVYGTAGAILIGVPIGFLTSVYLAKLATKKVKTVMESAVSLLAGIPSVVYGLVGMIVLVPAIRRLFHIPDGASLFAAIIVLSVMILPSSEKEVDEKLHYIMHSIHEQCVKFGTEQDGYIDYVKGANIAGFMKVANAMMAQGVV